MDGCPRALWMDPCPTAFMEEGEPCQDSLEPLLPVVGTPAPVSLPCDCTSGATFRQTGSRLPGADRMRQHMPFAAVLSEGSTKSPWKYWHL